MKYYLIANNNNLTNEFINNLNILIKFLLLNI